MPELIPKAAIKFDNCKLFIQSIRKSLNTLKYLPSTLLLKLGRCMQITGHPWAYLMSLRNNVLFCRYQLWSSCASAMQCKRSLSFSKNRIQWKRMLIMRLQCFLSELRISKPNTIWSSESFDYILRKRPRVISSANRYVILLSSVFQFSS